MSDFNIYDIRTLAEERGIVITFGKAGMEATQVGEDICQNSHQIEYDLLINLDMTLEELMDVWFPQKED